MNSYTLTLGDNTWAWTSPLAIEQWMMIGMVLAVLFYGGWQIRKSLAMPNVRLFREACRRYDKSKSLEDRFVIFEVIRDGQYVIYDTGGYFKCMFPIWVRDNDGKHGRINGHVKYKFFRAHELTDYGVTPMTKAVAIDARKCLIMLAHGDPDGKVHYHNAVVEDGIQDKPEYRWKRLEV